MRERIAVARSREHLNATRRGPREDGQTCNTDTPGRVVTSAAAPQTWVVESRPVTQHSKQLAAAPRMAVAPRPVRRKKVLTMPMSLTEAAYEELKRRIITLVYPPGSYINEAQLCEDLQIGRTPVHQAVNRLSLEGMINIIPRKGNIVSPISLEDALAVFEVRLILEPECARIAARLASESQIKSMDALLAPARRLIDRREIEVLMNIDRDFHILLAGCARNKVLEQMLMRLHERSLRFWFVSLSDEHHVATVIDEHVEIVDCLRRRDGEKAAGIMRDHIQSARERIRCLG